MQKEKHMSGPGESDGSGNDAGSGVDSSGDSANGGYDNTPASEQGNDGADE